MTTRVVVADDHDLVRVGLVRMLEDINDIDVIGEAASGEEAVQHARNLEPDVIVMDVKMPGIGGIEATRKITAQYPNTKIVAVSALDDAPFPQRLLKAGAMAYLTKGAEINEMVAAIKHAVCGKQYLSPQIAQQMALSSVNPDHDNPFDQLSERELQICMMVINCEKVQDISDKLCLSSKTVNSYRYRIFEKLDITGDVELTRLAIRHGLIEPEDV
ncbi:MAG: UvrY/SirA/GacA family response regulator transcription factor [Pseudomonadales bacterium]|nr:UvrY/SirA/GacA family response regulator transcription factor [Pseudomonadales bacterium]